MSCHFDNCPNHTFVFKTPMMRYNHLKAFQVLTRLKTTVNNPCRTFSAKLPYEEVQIPVPWGHVAGKYWGSKNTQPILTFHGWQDNCGSFDRLIPLLLDNNRSFLAVDFPGHGLSSRIPSGLYCHFTNNFILIRYLVNYFNWPKVTLMAHSMGAISSFVYTLLYPNEVEFLICIDNFKPIHAKNNVQRMAHSIEKFSKYSQHEMSQEEPPSYTLEEIQAKIWAPNNHSILPEYSMHIAERNIAPSKLHPGKYYFSRDPRWKLLELMNFPQEDVLEMSKHVKCPILIGKATKTATFVTDNKDEYYQVLDVLKANSADCQYHMFEGTHHFHLNNPEKLAVFINEFITKHSTVISRTKKELL